jgi:hypothetical protein
MIRGTRRLLLLGLDSATQVAILDVSGPKQPGAIDTASGAAAAPATEVNNSY